MKKLLLILFLLVSLPAFAAESEVKIPSQFLGRWEPYSHGAGSLALEIMPNGLIYYTSPKTDKTISISLYRHVLNTDKEAYLVVHEPDDKLVTRFWKFSLTAEEYNKAHHQEKLVMLYGTCDIDTDDFAHRTQAELQDILKNRKCPGNQPMIGGDFPGEASWIRKVR